MQCSDTHDPPEEQWAHRASESPWGWWWCGHVHFWGRMEVMYLSWLKLFHHNWHLYGSHMVCWRDPGPGTTLHS
jgi:hypothetical protein